MSARRFLVISVFNILLLFSAVPVSAQSGQGQWVNDLYIVDLYRDGVFCPRIFSLFSSLLHCGLRPRPSGRNSHAPRLKRRGIILRG
jgi:hypothetical protein